MKETMKVKALCILILSASTIAAATPINRDQAHQLSDLYFVKYFAREGCGGISSPLLKGNYWESTVKIGYSGKPNGIIRVNRQTGRTSYLGSLILKPDVSAESLQDIAAIKYSHSPK